MGASKSKADTTSCAQQQPPSMQRTAANKDPVQKKAADFVSKPKAKEVAPASEPISLPTKSWRALLENAEAPMNKDAKPFTPGAVPVPQQTTTKGPPGLEDPAAAKEDDPEWMQYLSKKLNAAESPQKPTPNANNANRNNAGVRFQKEQDRQVPCNPPAGPRRSAAEDSKEGSIGGITIHTESYLQLLREGAPKKRSMGNAANRRKITPPAASFENAPAGAPPMESLVKKWSTALKPKTLEGETSTEEVPVQRTIQDDIRTEKMLLDQDLSDPAYFSDSEPSNGKTSASLHRLGRRPQVTKANIRSYVMQDLNFLLDQVVGMMLLRLQRFTDQQNSFFSVDAPISTLKNDSALAHQPRRFVIGLKEVARRTKQSKLSCLLVAPDIEEDGNSGGLDDRMRELLGSAHQNGIPVIFALSRARLGKALGKNLHISVLGILDATGAQDLLDESVRLAGESQQTWLARLAK